jgi:hypothetical protein
MRNCFVWIDPSGSIRLDRSIDRSSARGETMIICSFRHPSSTTFHDACLFEIAVGLIVWAASSQLSSRRMETKVQKAKIVVARHK